MLTQRKNIKKFLIITLLALATTTSNALAGTISGKVTDNAGIGIEGVDVTVSVLSFLGWDYQNETQTDAEGYYKFQNLHANDYQIYYGADSQGYLSEYYDNAKSNSGSAKIITLSENGNEIADAKLDKKPVLRGTVKDISGQTLKDVSVEVYSSGNKWNHRQSTLTNVDGEYAFEKENSLYVLQNKTRLKFKTKNKGYEFYKDAITFDAAEDIVVGIDEERTIDAVLGDLPSGSIRGKVTNNAGIPLEGVIVSALYKDSNDWLLAGSIQTISGGHYEFKNLPANDYNIYFNAWSQGYQGEYFDDQWGSATVITLSENGNEIANAKLDKWPVLRGTVKNPSGQLLKNIEVVVYYGLEQLDGSIYWDPYSRTQTNKNGEYAFEKGNSIVVKHIGYLDQPEFKMRLKFSSDSNNYQFYKDAITLDEAEDLVMKIDEEYTIDITLDAENQEPESRVSVIATDDTAAETGNDTGLFTIRRTGGNTTEALTVEYTLGGTAINGKDYQKLEDSIIIPAGQSKVTVAIVPINDLMINETDETVILTLIDPVARERTSKLSKSSIATKVGSPAVITIINNANGIAAKSGSLQQWELIALLLLLFMGIKSNLRTIKSHSKPQY